MELLGRVLRTFELRNQLVAGARTLMAVAQVSVLLFNSDQSLFPHTAHDPAGFRCDGVQGLSLWCLGGADARAMTLDRGLVIGVLAVVASGYRPRWTCVPHWYVSFSLSASISLPSGGEHVAQLVSMLLIPVFLGDDRRWHWVASSAPGPRLPPSWHGAALASYLAIRVQASAIYITAAVSKLQDSRWRDGTAMFNIAYHPIHGLHPALLRLVGPALEYFPLVAGLTWGAVGVEALMGALVLGGNRMRLLALWLGGVLHLSIMAWMGLPSFELIMIALLLVVNGGRSQKSGRQPDETDDGNFNRNEYANYGH